MGYVARRRDRPSDIVIGGFTIEEARRIMGSPTTPIQDATINPTWTKRKFLESNFIVLNNIRNLGLIEPNFSLLTTTPLNANATFTSTWFDLSSYGFGQISILATSDQSGTLWFDISDDQVNLKSISASLVGPGDATILCRLYGRWCRVRYVNGATAQTRFTLSRRFMTA